jgi:transposase
MYKYQKNIVYKINNLINKNNKLNKIFNYKTKNRKYSNKTLIKCIINILKDGISFRSIGKYKKIKWQTIYKFYCKLIQNNVIKIIFDNIVNDYNKKYINNNIFITDTTLIPNKLGINDIGYNPQYPKHKSSKISIISDINGIPLNINCSAGNVNDSKILYNQLDDFQNTNSYLLNNNNILLGDAGYDSNKIRDKLNTIKFGKLLAAKNKRNIKNKIKLESIKLSLEEKKILKKRIKIEHTNAHLKQYKRISIRYDKYISHYINFIYLACINIIITAYP